MALGGWTFAATLGLGIALTLGHSGTVDATYPCPEGEHAVHWYDTNGNGVIDDTDVFACIYDTPATQPVTAPATTRPKPKPVVIVPTTMIVPTTPAPTTAPATSTTTTLNMVTTTTTVTTMTTSTAVAADPTTDTPATTTASSGDGGPSTELIAGVAAGSTGLGGLLLFLKRRKQDETVSANRVDTSKD
jgi:hypothetical protein